MTLSFIRRTFLRLSAGILVAASGAALSPAYADAAAEQYVQTILDEAEPVLSASDKQEFYDGVEALVAEHVDMRRVGRFVLGQYARKMTDAQKEVYFPLFKKYATLIYQNTLSNYEGQRIVVTGSVDRSERDIIVNSKLADPSPGDALANAVIHWRVYKSREGELSVVDAGADNVWLAIEQRSQFTSIIANNGGGEAGIDALIAEIRTHVED